MAAPIFCINPNLSLEESSASLDLKVPISTIFMSKLTVFLQSSFSPIFDNALFTNGQKTKSIVSKVTNGKKERWVKEIRIYGL